MDPNFDKPSKQTYNIGFGIAFFFVGVVAGFAGLQYSKGKIELMTEVLIAASYLLFGLLIITFVIIFYFRSYFSKKLFGTSPKNVHTALQDTQRAANYVTDRIAEYILKDAPAEIRDRVRSLVPRLAHQLFWARLRNWWWQWILGMFVAIGGLTGTLLLMNQNDLLQNQNVLINRQMSLEEANRRSALIVLMSNIMDKVDSEIQRQQAGMSKLARENSRYSLSQSLIGQIAALSHGFKPYKYMEGDSLIKKPLSPERGQLLTTLTSLPLDSLTMMKIYRTANFQNADLKKAVLIDAFLSGADLREADLSHADLTEAILNNTDLTEAVLYDADLRFTSMYFAILNNANLTEANLSKSELIHANLSGANLTQSKASKAIFTDANLEQTNLNQVENFTVEQASQTRSLFKCTGLSDSIKTALQQTHPHLFMEY